MRWSWWVSMSALVACLGCPLVKAAEVAAPPLPIAALDLERYLGRWHEVARYPNRFQRQCVGNVEAIYRALADGRVEVTNRCRVESGEMTQAIGVARRLDGDGSPRLEVRFAPAWLSFIPAVWGDYWVIDLDAGYQLAAVSGPSREYLWILSRTPEVAPAVYAALLERLRAQGFDTDKLVLSSRD